MTHMLSEGPSTEMAQSMASMPPTVCFLVGVTRSGSTWLQRLLQSHPRICGGEESHFFSLFATPMKVADKMHGDGQQYVGPLCYIDRDGFDDAIRTLWMTVFDKLYTENPGCLVHLEKSPVHVRYLDEIVRIFPEAKIIFLTRDSRAVVSSTLHGSKTWAKHWASDNAREVAINWHGNMKRGFEWQARHPDHPMLRLKYEDLMADTEGELDRILSFLLPDAEDRQAEETLAVYHAKSKSRSDPAGFARVRGAEGWKKDLSYYGRFVTWRYTRKMMRKLGYALSIFN